MNYIYILMPCWLCCFHRRPRRHRRRARAVPPHPLTLSHHRAVPCCRVAVAPSIAVKSPSCHPLPPTVVVLSVHRRPARAVPCRQGAIVPSLVVEEPSHRPLPLRSRRAVPRRRGAVAPSIAIKELSRRPSPSRIRRPCRQAALTLAGVVTNIRHSSRPSQASRPAGCRVASPHAAASHLPAPLIAALPLVPLVWLIVASSRFSQRHLPSASASASHRATASCHAPLGPLVWLVKASPLLTPPPPICGIIESSQWIGLMLV